MTKRNPRPWRYVVVDDGLTIVYDPDGTLYRPRDVIGRSRYVGIGGPRWVDVDLDLGNGVFRPKKPHGIRVAVWDAAYGYVSGFRKRDIAYYVLTRSLSHAVCVRVLRWERKRNRSRNADA